MKKLTEPVRKIPTVNENPGYRTLPEMLEQSALKFSESLCYLTPRDGQIYKLSYEEVYQLIRKLAAHLKALGLKRGDHIAVLGENKPEWGISFFAVSWIGAVAIPLDARANHSSHKFIMSYSSVKAVIASESFISSIEASKDELKELNYIIHMDSAQQICSEYKSGADREDVDPEDLLEIIFTSGSTGDPKGVMLSHVNVMSNVSDIYSVLDYSESDRTFSILPIHHSYECVAGLITPFAYGMSVFYARSLKPRELLEDLKAAEPTIWLNAPTILEKLYNRIESDIQAKKGISRLITKAIPNSVLGRLIKKRLGLHKNKLIASSGAHLPERVSTGFRGYGFNIIQAYGLTEASPLITLNPVNEPKHSSIGMVIPSVEVQIRDIDDEGNGEICAKGPNIMRGYYRNDTATQETVTQDGWLLTGDIGYFDEDGYLYITGRKKFVIVTKGGKNIHPEEIEEKLTESPLISEALVFSPDDESIQSLLFPDMEQIKMKLDNQTGQSSNEMIWELLNKEVRNINLKLEPYKRIRHFALRTEEFPKTTTNKIKRIEFRDLDIPKNIKAL